jgi:hypothetical protein
MKKTVVKEGLLLLGSFSIACNAASILHELSHGLAAVLTGGTFVSMTINPFSWSYCYLFTANQLVHLLAGAGGAILFGMLLFCILYRWARPWLLPVLLIGPLALLDNGSYYFVDTVMRSGGDSCQLIDQGVPPVVSASAGLMSVAAGLILVALLIHKIGLLRYGFNGRLVVLSIGILPNAAGMLVWNGIYNRNEAGLWAVYSGATVLLMLLFAAIPTRLYQKETSSEQSLTWKPVIVINVLYAGLLILLLAGPFAASGQSSLETFKERPSDFPAVMAAPPFAMDVSYQRSSVPNSHSQWLSYNFPESIPPDQIRSYLTDLHLAYGYHLQKTLIQDPNETLNDSWVEQTEEIYGIPISTKHYKQFWIKIDSQPLKSLVTVSYVWKKGKFQNAYVIQTAYPETDYETLYKYVSAQPEQFDPNEIEQLKILHQTQVNTQTE